MTYLLHIMNRFQCLHQIQFQLQLLLICKFPMKIQFLKIVMSQREFMQKRNYLIKWLWLDQNLTYLMSHIQILNISSRIMQIMLDIFQIRKILQQWLIMHQKFIQIKLLLIQCKIKAFLIVTSLFLKMQLILCKLNQIFQSHFLNFWNSQIFITFWYKALNRNQQVLQLYWCNCTQLFHQHLLQSYIF